MDNQGGWRRLPPGDFTLGELPRIKVVADFLGEHGLTWFFKEGSLFLVNTGFLFQFTNPTGQGLSLTVVRFSDKTGAGPTPVQTLVPGVGTDLAPAFEAFLTQVDLESPSYPWPSPQAPGLQALTPEEIQHWKLLLKKLGYRDLLDPKPEKPNPWQKLTDNLFRRP